MPNPIPISIPEGPKSDSITKKVQDSKRVFYSNMFTVEKPGTTLHRQTNKFHSQCLTLANGDWDQSFPIPQEVKLEISHWLTVLNQWDGKEISLFPSYDYVLRTDASESGAGATLMRGNKVIKTWSFQWSSTQSTQQIFLHLKSDLKVDLKRI
ncbi:hypothetical protein ACTFIZ_012918 [Dictyostelium cf. discoideum]